MSLLPYLMDAGEVQENQYPSGAMHVDTTGIGCNLGTPVFSFLLTL